MVSSQLLENPHGVSASSDCVYSLGISLILWSNFLLSFVRTWESSKKHWDWKSVWIQWIRIPSGGTGLKWKNELDISNTSVWWRTLSTLICRSQHRTNNTYRFIHSLPKFQKWSAERQIRVWIQIMFKS
jgi:hypothetical protein